MSQYKIESATGSSLVFNEGSVVLTSSTANGSKLTVDKVDVKNVDASGNLTVSESLSANSLTVSESVDAKNLTVSESVSANNMVASGNLTVSESVSANSLTVSESVDAKNLTVSESVSAKNVDASGNLTVSESVDAKNLTVSESVDAKNLTVSESVDAKNLTVSESVSANNVVASGNLTVSESLSAKNLTINGIVSYPKLNEVDHWSGVWLNFNNDNDVSALVRQTDGTYKRYKSNKVFDKTGVSFDKTSSVDRTPFYDSGSVYTQLPKVSDKTPMLAMGENRYEFFSHNENYATVYRHTIDNTGVEKNESLSGNIAKRIKTPLDFTNEKDDTWFKMFEQQYIEENNTLHGDGVFSQRRFWEIFGRKIFQGNHSQSYVDEFLTEGPVKINRYQKNTPELRTYYEKLKTDEDVLEYKIVKIRPFDNYHHHENSSNTNIIEIEYVPPRQCVPDLLSEYSDVSIEGLPLGSNLNGLFLSSRVMSYSAYNALPGITSNTHGRFSCGLRLPITFDAEQTFKYKEHEVTIEAGSRFLNNHHLAEEITKKLLDVGSLERLVYYVSKVEGYDNNDVKTAEATQELQSSFFYLETDDEDPKPNELVISSDLNSFLNMNEVSTHQPGSPVPITINDIGDKTYQNELGKFPEHYLKGGNVTKFFTPIPGLTEEIKNLNISGLKLKSTIGKTHITENPRQYFATMMAMLKLTKFECHAAIFHTYLSDVDCHKYVPSNWETYIHHIDKYNGKFIYGDGQILQGNRLDFLPGLGVLTGTHDGFHFPGNPVMAGVNATFASVLGVKKATELVSNCGYMINNYLEDARYINRSGELKSWEKEKPLIDHDRRLNCVGIFKSKSDLNGQIRKIGYILHTNQIQTSAVLSSQKVIVDYFRKRRITDLIIDNRLNTGGTIGSNAWYPFGSRIKYNYNRRYYKVTNLSDIDFTANLAKTIKKIKGDPNNTLNLPTYFRKYYENYVLDEDDGLRVESKRVGISGKMSETQDSVDLFLKNVNVAIMFGPRTISAPLGKYAFEHKAVKKVWDNEQQAFVNRTHPNFLGDGVYVYGVGEVPNLLGSSVDISHPNIISRKNEGIPTGGLSRDLVPLTSELPSWGNYGMMVHKNDEMDDKCGFWYDLDHTLSNPTVALIREETSDSNHKNWKDKRIDETIDFLLSNEVTELNKDNRGKQENLSNVFVHNIEEISGMAKKIVIRKDSPGMMFHPTKFKFSYKENDTVDNPLIITVTRASIRQQSNVSNIMISYSHDDVNDLIEVPSDTYTNAGEVLNVKPHLINRLIQFTQDPNLLNEELVIEIVFMNVSDLPENAESTTVYIKQANHSFEPTISENPTDLEIEAQNIYTYDNNLSVTCTINSGGDLVINGVPSIIMNYAPDTDTDTDTDPTSGTLQVNNLQFKSNIGETVLTAGFSVLASFMCERDSNLYPVDIVRVDMSEELQDDEVAINLKKIFLPIASSFGARTDLLGVNDNVILNDGEISQKSNIVVSSPIIFQTIDEKVYDVWRNGDKLHIITNPFNTVESELAHNAIEQGGVTIDIVSEIPPYVDNNYRLEIEQVRLIDFADIPPEHTSNLTTNNVNKYMEVTIKNHALANHDAPNKLIPIEFALYPSNKDIDTELYDDIINNMSKAAAMVPFKCLFDPTKPNFTWKDPAYKDVWNYDAWMYRRHFDNGQWNSYDPVVKVNTPSTQNTIKEYLGDHEMCAVYESIDEFDPTVRNNSDSNITDAHPRTLKFNPYGLSGQKSKTFYIPLVNTSYEPVNTQIFPSGTWTFSWSDMWNDDHFSVGPHNNMNEPYLNWLNGAHSGDYPWKNYTILSLYDRTDIEGRKVLKTYSNKTYTYLFDNDISLTQFEYPDDISKDDTIVLHRQDKQVRLTQELLRTLLVKNETTHIVLNNPRILDLFEKARNNAWMFEFDRESDSDFISRLLTETNNDLETYLDSNDLDTVKSSVKELFKLKLNEQITGDMVYIKNILESTDIEINIPTSGAMTEYLKSIQRLLSRTGIVSIPQLVNIAKYVYNSQQTNEPIDLLTITSTDKDNYDNALSNLDQDIIWFNRIKEYEIDSDDQHTIDGRRQLVSGFSTEGLLNLPHPTDNFSNIWDMVHRVTDALSTNNDLETLIQSGSLKINATLVEDTGGAEQYTLDTGYILHDILFKISAIYNYGWWDNWWESYDVTLFGFKRTYLDPGQIFDSEYDRYMYTLFIFLHLHLRNFSITESTNASDGSQLQHWAYTILDDNMYPKNPESAQAFAVDFYNYGYTWEELFDALKEIVMGTPDDQNIFNLNNSFITSLVDPNPSASKYDSFVTTLNSADTSNFNDDSITESDFEHLVDLMIILGVTEGNRETAADILINRATGDYFDQDDTSIFKYPVENDVNYISGMGNENHSLLDYFRLFIYRGYHNLIKPQGVQMFENSNYNPLQGVIRRWVWTGFGVGHWENWYDAEGMGAAINNYMSDLFGDPLTAFNGDKTKMFVAMFEKAMAGEWIIQTEDVAAFPTPFDLFKVELELDVDDKTVITEDLFKFLVTIQSVTGDNDPTGTLANVAATPNSALGFDFSLNEDLTSMSSVLTDLKTNHGQATAINTMLAFLIYSGYYKKMNPTSFFEVSDFNPNVAGNWWDGVNDTVYEYLTTLNNHITSDAINHIHNLRYAWLDIFTKASKDPNNGWIVTNDDMTGLTINGTHDIIPVAVEFTDTEFSITLRNDGDHRSATTGSMALYMNIHAITDSGAITYIPPFQSNTTELAEDKLLYREFDPFIAAPIIGLGPGEERTFTIGLTNKIPYGDYTVNLYPSEVIVYSDVFNSGTYSVFENKEDTVNNTITFKSKSFIEILNQSSNVNVLTDDDGVNKYVFNGSSKFIEGRHYGLENGTYTFRNVPSNHPMALIIDADHSSNISYSGDNQVASPEGIDHNFYYGDITVTVTGDFGNVSVYCKNHGYMGGEDLLQYSPAFEVFADALGIDHNDENRDLFTYLGALQGLTGDPNPSGTIAGALTTPFLRDHHGVPRVIEENFRQLGFENNLINELVSLGLINNPMRSEQFSVLDYMAFGLYSAYFLKNRDKDNGEGPDQIIVRYSNINPFYNSTSSPPFWWEAQRDTAIKYIERLYGNDYDPLTDTREPLYDEKGQAALNDIMNSDRNKRIMWVEFFNRASKDPNNGGWIVNIEDIDALDEPKHDINVTSAVLEKDRIKVTIANHGEQQIALNPIEGITGILFDFYIRDTDTNTDTYLSYLHQDGYIPRQNEDGSNVHQFIYKGTGVGNDPGLLGDTLFAPVDELGPGETKEIHLLLNTDASGNPILPAGDYKLEMYPAWLLNRGGMTFLGGKSIYGKSDPHAPEDDGYTNDPNNIRTITIPTTFT